MGVSGMLACAHQDGPGQILSKNRSAPYPGPPSYRDTELARTQTATEIENTRQQIEELRRETTSSGPSQSQIETNQREEDLEKQLAELSTKLEKLDEMNKELQQEKEKAAQLSRELEGRERREKELLGRIGTGAKIPPLLLLTSPEDGRQNETDSVRLTGAVEDDQGLMRIEVLVNGRPVESGDARGIRPVEGTAPKRLSFERRILLAQGANRILVKATDTDGLTSERGLTVYYSTSRRNVWAVVVGINDYPQLPKLKYAVNDAREFHRFLEQKPGARREHHLAAQRPSQPQEPAQHAGDKAQKCRRPGRHGDHLFCRPRRHRA